MRGMVAGDVEDVGQERKLCLPLEELPNLPGKCDAILCYDVEHGISERYSKTRA